MAISIHAPLAGRDRAGAMIALRGYAFQSTRPSRGATNFIYAKIEAKSHFNPRAPRGARRSCRRLPSTQPAISIHAPLAGRDDRILAALTCIAISIHAPLAGRDDRILAALTCIAISIHAPLAGRD